MVTQPLPQAACSNADNSFREEIFPDIQCKPPLTQLEVVSSHPLFQLGRRAWHPPCFTLSQAAAESSPINQTQPCHYQAT